MDPVASATASLVDIVAANNVTLREAFQFGLSTDTWQLAPNFNMSIKMANSDVTPLASFSTAAGTIVVDDIVQRIIHLNVSEAALQAALPNAGQYVYDLVMFDASVPPIRTLMMQGSFYVTTGVTET